MTGCAPGGSDDLNPDEDTLASAIQRGPTRTLYTWYSASRGDWYTTTDPAWVGTPGATRSPDYVFVRAEGQVLDPAFPEPGSRPIYTWYSAARGDAFTTTNAAWAGRAGDVRDGYSFLRLEGHAYAAQVAGTLPLTLYWNSATQDNRVNADPRVNALPAMRPGYPSGNIEGYVLPPPSAQVGATSADFGYDTLRVNGARAVGARPLMIVMVQFRDQAFAAGDTCATRRARFFGTTAPTMAGYFLENSNQRFTWSDAGCVGPIQAPDLAGATYDESTYTGAMNARFAGTTYLGGEGTELLAQTIANLAASGVDFARYDTNLNGTVETNELTIAMVFPGPGDEARAHNRGVTSPSFVSAGRTLRYQGAAAFFGEASNFTTVAHELSHSLGTLDLYGSGVHSGGLTLMSDTSSAGPGDLRTWHLDPWHKIRLGWVEPRVLPITAAGDLVALDAPQTTSGVAEARRPVILYDPARSLNEYMLVEFRNRSPSSGGRYDANLYDWRSPISARGVAVWHVSTDAGHTPLILPGLVIGAGANGVINTTVRGDDLLQPGLITPGFNRVLESAPSGDDVYFNDRMVVARGVTDAGSPVARGNRGFSGLLRPEDNDYALTWSDGSTAVRMRSSAVSADGARVYLEFSRGAQLTSRLDYAPLTARAGATVDVTGFLGAQQNARIPSLRAASGLVPLTVTAWSPTRATLSVPSTVAPGRYDLVVFNPSYLGVGNAMQVDVYR